jgi:Flp pilus assembly protein TadD
MGRAFAQIITRDLAGAPGVYAIPFERLHTGEAALGIRPSKAPGISAERSLALGAGANRLGYGEYWLRGGKLEARLTIEDPQRQKVVRVIEGSAAAAGPLVAANALAREISRQAEPYPTRSREALEAYCDALESDDPSTKSRLLEAAIADDPDFSLPYFLLSQLTVRQDRAGALALLERALARGAKVPELERARGGFLAANLRGDSAAALQSLRAWSGLTPNDAEVWRALGQEAMGQHQYIAAMQAFQKALSIEPDDIDALNRLGYAAAYSGQLDTAMSALRGYQARRPLDANPLDSMGDVNLILGRLRDAEGFYLQAAKRDPSFLAGGEFFKAAMARLMSGDLPGADGLFKQFADTRNAANDPLADFRQAQWAWISGRRKEGYGRMAAFAQSADQSASRPAASQAYSQLAIWSLALGDRGKAAQMAQKAAGLADSGSPSAPGSLAPFARFVSQPSAPASEWAARAEQAFPAPAEKQAKEAALAYALLADKQFAEAARVLEQLHQSSNANEGFAVMLAWAYLQIGKPKEAAALLRFNPLPSAEGVRDLGVFDFPRLFYLRGRIAALAGNPQQAESYYKLFLTLSGDEPLQWEEEAAARKASNSL